jgi:hypothetical protein
MKQFTKKTVTIQPQAQVCMDKELVSFEDVLKTMNTWEAAEANATNPFDLKKIASYQDAGVEAPIPTIQKVAKGFPARRIIVTFTTSFRTHAGKTIKYATVHWVATEPSYLPLDWEVEEIEGDINIEKHVDKLKSTKLNRID